MVVHPGDALPEGTRVTPLLSPPKPAPSREELAKSGAAHSSSGAD